MLKNWKMEALSIKDIGVVITVIKKRMKVGNGGAKVATRTAICRTREGNASAHTGGHDTWRHRSAYSSRICERNALGRKRETGGTDLCEAYCGRP